jgi:integrase/recombinase XerD
MGISGSIHRCRRVYGTRLLRAGVNIRTVQQLMRHSNLDTTAAYTAVNEVELRNAIDMLTA